MRETQMKRLADMLYVLEKGTYAECLKQAEQLFVQVLRGEDTRRLVGEVLR